MLAFYAFIRPQKAYLFDQNIQLYQYSILDFVCGDDFFTRLVFPDQFIEGGTGFGQQQNSSSKNYKTYQKLITSDEKSIMTFQMLPR